MKPLDDLGRVCLRRLYGHSVPWSTANTEANVCMNKSKLPTCNPLLSSRNSQGQISYNLPRQGEKILTGINGVQEKHPKLIHPAHLCKPQLIESAIHLQSEHPRAECCRGTNKAIDIHTALCSYLTIETGTLNMEGKIEPIWKCIKPYERQRFQIRWLVSLQQYLLIIDSMPLHAARFPVSEAI